MLYIAHFDISAWIFGGEVNNLLPGGGPQGAQGRRKEWGAAWGCLQRRSGGVAWCRSSLADENSVLVREVGPTCAPDGVARWALFWKRRAELHLVTVIRVGLSW